MIWFIFFVLVEIIFAGYWIINALRTNEPVDYVMAVGWFVMAGHVMKRTHDDRKQETQRKADRDRWLKNRREGRDYLDDGGTGDR